LAEKASSPLRKYQKSKNSEQARIPGNEVDKFSAFLHILYSF